MALGAYYDWSGLTLSLKAYGANKEVVVALVSISAFYSSSVNYSAGQKDRIVLQ
jgi:hypothetical protein